MIAEIQSNKLPVMQEDAHNFISVFSKVWKVHQVTIDRELVLLN